MARKPINLFLEEKVIKKLKHEAIDRDTNVSSLVEEWVEKRKKGKGDKMAEMLTGKG